LEEGELLDELFQLPYQFSVPDILFSEELEYQHAHLLERGLILSELNSGSMLYVLDLTARVSGPSRNDCFALALAKQENCPLLSGDQALRKAAEQEAVVVMDHLASGAAGSTPNHLSSKGRGSLCSDEG
jgi:hypothetical protein